MMSSHSQQRVWLEIMVAGDRVRIVGHFVEQMWRDCGNNVAHIADELWRHRVHGANLGANIAISTARGLVFAAAMRYTCVAIERADKRSLLMMVAECVR